MHVRPSKLLFAAAFAAGLTALGGNGIKYEPPVSFGALAEAPAKAVDTWKSTSGASATLIVEGFFDGGDDLSVTFSSRTDSGEYMPNILLRRRETIIATFKDVPNSLFGGGLYAQPLFRDHWTLLLAF